MLQFGIIPTSDVITNDATDAIKAVKVKKSKVRGFV